MAARSVRRATGAGVLLRARRLEVGGLGSQAGGPRPQPRVSDGDGNPRWAPRPVRMDLLPRATGPGGNGLRRLLYEPARLRRLRRALPPRRRARLGRQGLSRPDELARPAHRPQGLHRHQPDGRRRGFVRRLHDQLDHRPDEPILRRRLDAVDLQPGERVLAARHRPVGHPPARSAAVAGPRRAMATLADPLRAEHSHSTPPDRRRDGPQMRDVPVGGAVRRDAAARQDGRARPVPRRVA